MGGVEDEPFVDLVGEHESIVAIRHVGHRLQLVLPRHAPRLARPLLRDHGGERGGAWGEQRRRCDEATGGQHAGGIGSAPGAAARVRAKTWSARAARRHLG